MPQAQLEYTSFYSPKLLRYIRQTFAGAGVDNYTAPPSQNPDMFEQLTNIMPITTGGLQRRWGYQAWNTNASFELVAKNAYEFQNPTTGLRRIIMTAADGTGVSSSA